MKKHNGRKRSKNRFDVDFHSNSHLLLLFSVSGIKQKNIKDLPDVMEKFLVKKTKLQENDEIDEVPSEGEVPSEDEATSDAGEPTPKRAKVSSLDRIKALNSKPKERTPAKAPRTPKTPKVDPNTGLSKHVEGKTIEQHRRGFGDVVRRHLHSFYSILFVTSNHQFIFTKLRMFFKEILCYDFFDDAVKCILRHTFKI